MTNAESLSGRAASCWWTDYPVPAGSVRRWQVGPWRLLARRDDDEWWLATDADDEPLSQKLALSEKLDEGDSTLIDDPSTPWQRYACGVTDERLRLAPALADRSVVVRPQMPLNVLPARSAVLYVTLPVRIAVSVGSGVRLCESPSYRMPDTWFGTDTTDGELCYASKTWARLSIDELQRWPHRAVTPITVINQADDVLHVEKIKLPLEQLTLYATADDRLWTSALSLQRERDGESVTLRVERDSKLGNDAMVLAAPREAERGRLAGAVAGMFG